jgi:hypothetical protein
MVNKQQASGGSLVGFGLVFLIIFLLFPIFTWYLMWFAIIIMLIAGFFSLFTE